MEEYVKIGDDAFERIGTVEKISLSQIKDRLRFLQKQAQMSEPTDRELIDFAKAMHPYYTERLRIIEEINRLRLMIQRLESL